MSKVLFELQDKIKNKKEEMRQFITNKEMDKAEAMKAEIENLQSEHDKVRAKIEKVATNKNKSLFKNKGEVLFETENPEGYSLGGYLRGVVLNKWDDKNAKEKDLAIRNRANGTGEVLVPAELSSELIEKARNLSVIANVGVRFVPMNSKSLTMARQTGDVESHFLAAGAHIPESEAQFDAVTFEAKNMWTRTEIDIPLFEDAQNVEEILVNSLAQSIAQKMDVACLYGAGGELEPLGFVNQEGIQTMSGFTFDSYHPMTAAIRNIRNANYEPTAIAYNADLQASLEMLEDGDMNPRRQPMSFLQLENRVISNQVLNGQALMAQWNQFAVGMRREIVLEVSRDAGFENGMVHLRAYTRFDFQALQPSAGLHMTGTLPASPFTVGTVEAKTAKKK